MTPERKQELRDKFFNDCTGVKSGYPNDLDSLVVNMTPHNVFEWMCENMEPESDLLHIPHIVNAMHKFKEEKLPYAIVAYHYEAEIWSGMKRFIKWLRVKQGT